LMDSSVGGMLMMVGIDNVKPAVNQFVTAVLLSLKGQVVELSSKVNANDVELTLDEEKLAADLHAKLRGLLERKLEELEPSAFKKIIEHTLRHQLAWLVVWSSVLGSLMGAAAFVVTSSSG